MPKVADIFSIDELQQIRTVIEPKYNSNSYGFKYNGMAETLLEITANQDKQYSKKEWVSIIYSAGCFTKLEPQLSPILKAGIDRYHAYKS